jgi:prevent-host-death family protein
LRFAAELAIYLARKGAAAMQVSIFDAKNQLSALVAEAERGHEVTITRRGVAVAKLVPVSPGFDREKARRTAEALRRASRGITLGGVGIKALVEEGRD